MKTFKILKILFFISIGTFLLSCSNVIRDTDGDGISDTVNLVDDVYQLRANEDMRFNIGEYASRRLLPIWWYEPEGSLDIPSLRVTYSSITKYGVTYKLDDSISIKGNTAAIYKITEGADTGKFVLITLEPVPIFKEDMVILLVSKKTYTEAEKENAISDAKTINIPKIKMSISHLDLVFNPTMPESEYLSYENVAENIAAILANYDLLEFFGTGYSYVEKKELLKKYGYTPLFE